MELRALYIIYSVYECVKYQNIPVEVVVADAVAVAVAVAELLVGFSISPIFALFAANINSFFLSAISLLTRKAALRVSPHIS